jgi:membrane protease subunit HflC
VLLADAYRAALHIMGVGEAGASVVYANAYGMDRDLYWFYRSLVAYTATFRSKSEFMVLDPSAYFFQYLINYGSGRGPKPPQK